MRIEISRLRTLIDEILERMSTQTSFVEIPDDFYYWDVLKPERYDSNNQAETSLGNLSDDWRKAQTTTDPDGPRLVALSNLLRFIGDHHI